MRKRCNIHTGFHPIGEEKKKHHPLIVEKWRLLRFNDNEKKKSNNNKADGVEQRLGFFVRVLLLVPQHSYTMYGITP